MLRQLEEVEDAIEMKLLKVAGWVEEEEEEVEEKKQ